MMDYKCTIHMVDRDTWLRLAPGFADYNYRQAWDFGTACAARVGAASEHVAIQGPDSETLALADVRVRKLPVLGGGIAYINGGPLTRKGPALEEPLLCHVLNTLVEEYVTRRKLTLRIAPPLAGDSALNGLEQSFVQLGFAPLPERKKTIILDLRQDLDDIRKNFHQKWRNCLNQSEKNGLTVRSGQEIAVFNEFVPLFKQLISKKNFAVDLDADFYANVQTTAAEIDRFQVLLAEHEGKTVAGHVASILGDTGIYLLGAANLDGRNLKAAYFLQWQAIRLAKTAGCRWYDLGGINQEENPGVYEFKKRMGGKEVNLPGPYQITPGGIKALLTRFGEKSYTFIKPYLARA